MTISGNFEHFECFNFETDFLESENLFQKAGVPHHLHTKTVISEANIKANRTMIQNGPITKNGVLAVTT